MSAANLGGSRAVGENAQTAVGALEAQRVIAGLHDEALPNDAAWLRFVELASRYGRNSPACAAYIAEGFKRAAAA